MILSDSSRWSFRDYARRSNASDGRSMRSQGPQFSLILKLHPAPPKRRRLHLCNVFRSRTKSHRAKARYYIETTSPYEMTLHGQPAVVRCSLGTPANNISNSSLKDCDKSAMQDELLLYMRGLLEQDRILRKSDEDEDII